MVTEPPPVRRLRWTGVLANSEFRKLFSAYSLSAAGDGVQLFAMTFVVLGMGRSAAQLALVLAARELPTVALTLLSGVWADRFERRRLLLMSDLVCGACQLGIAAVVLTGHARIWHLVVIGLIFGAARSLFVPALSGLLPTTVPKDQLRQANAFVRTVQASTFVGGAPIAALIITVSSPGVAVLLDGVSFMASAMFLATMAKRVVARDDVEHEGVWHELRYGWREVRSRVWMLAELLRSSIDLPLAIAPFMVLGPIIAEQRMHGVSSWAIITTAYLAGTVVGPFLAQRFQPSRPMLTCTALMYTGAGPPLLLAFTSSVWAIAAAQAVKGCVVGFFDTVWATLLQQKVPDNARSRVSSWDFTLTTGLTPFGYLIAAPMTQQIGSTTLLSIGAIWVVVGVTGVLFVPDVRNLTWDD
jgi:MFS family permease